MVKRKGTRGSKNTKGNSNCKENTVQRQAGALGIALILQCSKVVIKFKSIVG
jgi:hypothetical protein